MQSTCYNKILCIFILDDSSKGSIKRGEVPSHGPIEGTNLTKTLQSLSQLKARMPMLTILIFNPMHAMFVVSGVHIET